MSLSLEGKGAPLGVGPAPSDEDSYLLFFFIFLRKIYKSGSLYDERPEKAWRFR